MFETSAPLLVRFLICFVIGSMPFAVPQTQRREGNRHFGRGDAGPLSGLGGHRSGLFYGGARRGRQAEVAGGRHDRLAHHLGSFCAADALLCGTPRRGLRSGHAVVSDVAAQEKPAEPLARSVVRGPWSVAYGRRSSTVRKRTSGGPD